MRFQALPTTTRLTLLLMALCLALPASSGADEEESKTEWIFPHRLELNCDEGEEDCHRDLLRRFVGGGFLGVETTPMTAELRTFFNAPEDSGVLISRVEEDSAAARAGLMVGDVITSIDGEPVKSTGSLARLIRGKKGGELVGVDYIRLGNAASTQAELAERTRHPVVFDLSEVYDGLEGLERLEGLETLQHLPRKLGISKDVMERAVERAQRALEEQNLEERLRTFETIDRKSVV